MCANQLGGCTKNASYTLAPVTGMYMYIQSTLFTTPSMPLKCAIITKLLLQLGHLVQDH